MAESTPELLARLHANDAAAWREAFQALYPVVWRACGQARWTLPNADREEVASDTLLEITRRIRELQTWPQVTALAFVIARRKAVSRLRATLAQKRRGTAGGDVALDEARDVAVDEADLVAITRWAELAEALETLLARLGDPAAALVRGYTLEGLSYEELAARHAMPIGTVGVTLHRALHRLRRELAATPKLQKELSLYLRLFLLA